jgi:aminomethyltransferase
MAEYDALVNRVTLWDVAVERQIQVRGRDAEAFVNFVITRDATRIPPMRARYVILCNEAGGILNDPVLLRLSDDEFWFSLSDSDLMLWLQGVNVGRRFDVDIREIDVCPVQVQGPRSVDLMVDLVGPTVAELPSYGLMEASRRRTLGGPSRRRGSPVRRASRSTCGMPRRTPSSYGRRSCRPGVPTSSR